MEGYGRIGFFEAVIGLLLDPGSTTARLFEEEPPRFLFTLLFATLMTVVLPLLATLHPNDPSLLRGHPALILLAVGVISLLLFILFETFMLSVLLQVPVSLTEASAAAIYSLVPMVLVAWLFYLFSYLAAGSLDFAEGLLQGKFPADTPFLRSIPYAAVLAQFISLVVFFCCVRCMGSRDGMHSVTAFFITIFSLLPLYFAFIAALRISDHVQPGSEHTVYRMVYSMPMPETVQKSIDQLKKISFVPRPL